MLTSPQSFRTASANTQRALAEEDVSYMFMRIIYRYYHDDVNSELKGSTGTISDSEKARNKARGKAITYAAEVLQELLEWEEESNIRKKKGRKDESNSKPLIPNFGEVILEAYRSAVPDDLYDKLYQRVAPEHHIASQQADELSTDELPEPMEQALLPLPASPPMQQEEQQGQQNQLATPSPINQQQQQQPQAPPIRRRWGLTSMFGWRKPSEQPDGNVSPSSIAGMSPAGRLVLLCG